MWRIFTRCVARSVPFTGTLGAPKALFTSRSAMVSAQTRTFSVSADGQRFVVSARPPEMEPRELVVVTNWFAELRAKMAVAER